MCVFLLVPIVLSLCFTCLEWKDAMVNGDSNDAAESDSADKGSDEEETEESSCGSEVCK